MNEKIFPTVLMALDFIAAVRNWFVRSSDKDGQSFNGEMK